MASQPMHPPQDASEEEVQAVHRLKAARDQLRREIAQVVVGQDDVLDQLLTALLCRGHVLLLGVPGLGKTLMAKSIARTLQMDYRRIQFTPDLMPSDIIGTDIIEEDPETGRRKLEFLQGPLFTNFLLADEINRAPPKTQAALLQAMQEQEVSVGRRSYLLEPPFFVVATQNPIEQEGTYPLPEAQLDRFMFNIPVTYPTPDEEVAIVKSTTVVRSAETRPVLDAAEIVRLQALVRGVPVADAVVRYAVDLVIASRPGHGEELASDPQVRDLRGQPSGFAVPDPRRQGASHPGRAVPRRFRRRPSGGRARPAASAGAQFPRPSRGRRRGSADPADRREQSRSE